MRGHLRVVVPALLAVVALVAGWRIVGLIRVDAAVARGDVTAVLRLDPDHAEALLADATRRLHAGDVAGAEGQARRVLRRSPIDGRAYRVLAQVAERRKQPAQALALYRIASTRAPRDVQALAWLAQYALDQRDYPGMLVQVDRVLSLSPGAGGRLYPVLADLAGRGVNELHLWAEVNEPEFCEDCGAPLFPNARGDAVHAEMPEDVEPDITHFH